MATVRPVCQNACSLPLKIVTVGWSTQLKMTSQCFSNLNSTAISNEALTSLLVGLIKLNDYAINIKSYNQY